MNPKVNLNDNLCHIRVKNELAEVSHLFLENWSSIVMKVEINNKRNWSIQLPRGSFLDLNNLQKINDSDTVNFIILFY